MSLEKIAVHLYVYDLTRGMARMMSAAILGRQIEGIWHTGIVAYGREFFFGSGGIQSCLPGSTILGPPDQVHPLGETEVPFSIFSDYVAGLSDSTFHPGAYDLLRHNCNNFSNELSVFLCGLTIPQHILDLPSEVLSTPFGQSLQPLLLSLSSQAVDPVTSAGSGALGLGLGVPRLREPSPESVALEAAIEEARRDSLKLEERREKILYKVDKLEKKKVKQQQQKNLAMADNNENSAAAASRSEVDGEETRPPREPPVVFNDVINVLEEFEVLSQLLKPIADDADRTSLDELGQYMIADEGSWVLGDGFLGFISKHLSDSSPAEVRLKLLRILAAAALKDDVILILHQDRRDHVLMNYAQNIDRLPLAEQEAVALLICNLFENGSSAEWLLYISEWNSPVSTQPLSNIRVTTKVAVTSLLAESSDLQNYGSAIIHNLAIKEVFDDVATELAMAILQFFSGEHCEEHIFRCMKGLLRFAYISHSEVPALIKMIGPDPTQFKGMSQRIDDLIEPLSDRLRSVRGFD